MIALFLAAALAYETDPVSGRDLPVPDVTAEANVLVDQGLDRAVATTNTRLRCKAPAARTRRVLARRIHAELGATELLWSRGAWGMWGHGRYSARLESEVEGLYWAEDGLFAEVSLWASPPLHLAGTSHMARLAGTWVGTDKLHHFFDVGHGYWRRSRASRHATAAIRWGTATEAALWGGWTSRVFSYADLRANLDGYRFYAGLLDDTSLLRVGDDGCVARAGRWDWAQWVDAEYDEYFNPAAYGAGLERELRRAMVDRRDELCAAWQRWRAPGDEARI
ncbi:MAG: hypothetical protein FJ102_25375, partial [Deltaproteobacteria bacterium]|nr:hypothetical protein [Deltaproteobacteria bacterium]